MPGDPPSGFGPFRLDRAGGRLLRDGLALRIGRRAFDTLTALLDAGGATLSKDTLLATVWPGLIVEENNLQVQISALRRTLGDSWIVTVPGRGYRFALDPPPSAPPPATPPLPDRPSLAVLPFASRSDDPAVDHFADGMVDDITTALSRLGGLFVVARNSTLAYKGKPIDVKQVGRDLGARYVIGGSVRQAGNRVRITCQLIDTTTATHVWADRFDGSTDDLFDLQDLVSTTIASAIEPSLRNAEIARARAKPAADLDAYDLYLHAFHHYELFSDMDRAAGIALCRRAIARDPGFSLAKALLAVLVSFEVSNGRIDRAAPESVEAVALARTALASVRDDPATLRFAGFAVAYVGLDLPAGRAALDRALLLNPNSASCRTFSGWLHLCAGEWQAAHDDFACAIRLNPLDPELRWAVVGQAQALLQLGHPDHALAALRRSYALGKGRKFGARLEVLCLFNAGRSEEANAKAAALRAAGNIATERELRNSYLPYPPEFVDRLIALYRAFGLVAADPG
jgi:TolB-like protein